MLSYRAEIEKFAGLAAIATTHGSTLLAFPGRQAGHVQLVRLPALGSRKAPSLPRTDISSAPPYQTIHIFLAHTSSLRTLVMSATGSLLCTSSVKGTLLRVYDTHTRQLVRELRRGTDQADIWSVAFSNQENGGTVACSSDKGTIHVWHVGDLLSHFHATSIHSQAAEQHDYAHESKEKSLKMFKPFLPAYFSSQWSDLTWRIPSSTGAGLLSRETTSTEEDDVAICVFVPQDSDSVSSLANEQHHLLVITRSGAWYRLSTSASQALRGEHSESYNIGHDSIAKASKARPTEDHKHCTMLEYRRFGPGNGENGVEDWSDDDD